MSLVVQLKIASAALMLLCAAMLFTSRMPTRARIAFSAFFLLVSMNSGLEAFRSWTGIPGDTYSLPRGLAIVSAAFDPFVLVYAMSVYPRENALHRTRVLAPFLVAAAALALTAPLAATEWQALHRTGIAVYTAIAYGVVALLAARHLLRRSEGPPGVLFPALALAAVPALVRVCVTLWYLAGVAGLSAPVLLLLPFLIDIFVIGVGGSMLAAHRGPRLMGIGLLFGGLADLPLYGAFGLRQIAEALGAAPAVANAITFLQPALEARWSLIAFLVVAAAYRGDALAMTPKGRQRWSQAALTVAAVILGIPLMLWLQERVFGVTASSLGPVELALVVTAFAFMPPTQMAASFVARKLFGAPGTDAGSVERFYSSAVAASYQTGRAKDVAYVRELREELGISDLRNAAIMMRHSSTHRLSAGALVSERYRIDALLRRGGAGRTFRAKDLILSRSVVVKEVPLDEGTDPAAILREARTLSSVSHPNVVQIHDALFAPDAMLIVMEFVESGSLQDAIRAHGTHDAESGARVLTGILAGLDAIHSAGIVHRDVKPANVLLAADGAPKIADFGLARWADAPTVQTQGLVHGTPGYIAPEVLAGEKPTPASDLYAVARIALLHVDLPATPAIDAWLARGLAEDPAARFASAREMADALREALRPTAAQGTRMEA